MRPNQRKSRLSFGWETCRQLLKLRVGIEVSSDEYEDILQECAKYLQPKIN